jgi:hypothetical protein
MAKQTGEMDGVDPTLRNIRAGNLEVSHNQSEPHRILS